jgi:hypothetical protein
MPMSRLETLQGARGHQAPPSAFYQVREPAETMTFGSRGIRRQLAWSSWPHCRLLRDKMVLVLLLQRARECSDPQVLFCVPSGEPNAKIPA